MARKSAREIALEIAEALSKVSEPELRYDACRKIVEHAINADRNEVAPSTKSELRALVALAEFYKREKKPDIARLLEKSAKRIKALSISNSRLRAMQHS